ncbi:uncharacterized protein LOC126842375 [Adelges cooleyi]|uniref:uncharacterized protein LOC126842375 n=1 Tax=Adelges cooleyi TaxID=133065 RepID=UPI00217FD361|nr:uncharacterized protein LOC126842375 [Adelges cooleyi]
MPSVAAASELSTVFQFRVSLLNNEFEVWRSVQMPSDFTFHDLHAAIQFAMDWEGVDKDNHFFEAIDNLDGTTHTIGSPGPCVFDERTVKLSDYFLEVNDSANYYYDYDTAWLHRVDLEKILPAGEDKVYPVYVEGVGL